MVNAIAVLTFEWILSFEWELIFLVLYWKPSQIKFCGISEYSVQSYFMNFDEQGSINLFELWLY